MTRGETTGSCPPCPPWHLQPDRVSALLGCVNFLFVVLKLSCVPHTSNESAAGSDRTVGVKLGKVLRAVAAT